MRIIGGQHKGRVIKAPPGLEVRPTTDFAKEGLFNILNNSVDFENAVVLDLFSGTGQIAMEFVSRGSTNVTTVESDVKNCAFIRSVCTKFSMDISVVKDDAFKYLEKASAKWDVIFADPPYELENIDDVHEKVFRKELLREGGTLIIEHGPRTDLSQLPGFMKMRKYGNVRYSFFGG